MKILIITHDDYPNYDGLSTRIDNIAKALSRYNIDVIVFAPNIDRRQPLFEKSKYYNILRTNIPIFKFILKYRIFARVYTTILQAILTVPFYFNKLKKLNVDVIVAEQFYSIPSALILNMFLKAKVIVDDIGRTSELLHATGNKFIANIFPTVERYFFKKCDNFIYTSKASQKYIRDRGGDGTIFLPNGVDTSLFVPKYSKPNTSKKSIFFNCTPLYYQNIDAIRNAINLGIILKDRTSSPFLIHLICGPLKYLPADIVGLAKKNRDCVLLEDRVEEIIPYIQSADIAILPYTPGHHIIGGNRLKALEYLSCGKIVITTKEGIDGIDGLLAGKHILTVDSLEEMQKILKEVIEQPQRFEHLGVEGRRFVETNYDWNNLIKAYLEFLGCYE